MSTNNRYDNVPISELTSSSMTLTIDDIGYLKRMFLLQDEVFGEEIKDMESRIITSLAEVLIKNNESIIKKLNIIQKDVNTIKDEVVSIKEDISTIYKEINSLQKRVGELEKKIVTLEAKIKLSI